MEMYWDNHFVLGAVTLNPRLIAAGFTATTLTIENTTYAYPFTDALGKGKDLINNSDPSWCNPALINQPECIRYFSMYLTLKRVGPGPDLLLNDYEEIAKFEYDWYHDRRGVAPVLPHSYPILYIARGSPIPRVYTCDLKGYDTIVRMQKLDANDIMQGAKGRIDSSKRPFNFQLYCVAGTVVSLQLEGQTLSGTGSDSVLKNQKTHNENIGIQLFDGEKQLKIGDKFLITNSAEHGSLPLRYYAYYYYKGGEVNGGPFKTQVTFTFTYE